MTVVCWYAVARTWGAVSSSPRSPYSRRSREEMWRRLPAGAVGVTLWTVAALINLVWGRAATGARVGFDAFFGLGFAAMLVALVAGFTGRPWWAIPPHLRTGRHAVDAGNSPPGVRDRSG